MSILQDSTQIALPYREADALIAHWLGRNVTINNIEHMDGGFCSSVYMLEFDISPFKAVLKRHEEAEVLQREKRCLDYLNSHANWPSPKVYLHESSCEIVAQPFLLIEYLPCVNLDSADIPPEQRANIETEIADALIELHSHHSTEYHSVGQNDGATCWKDLFLADLHENHRDVKPLLPADTWSYVGEVLPLAEGVMDIEQGCPTLIHGDMWAGNIRVNHTGDTWHLAGFIDSGSLRFADVEKELAYIEVFGSFGKTFWDRYKSKSALRDGYELRKQFYWLDTLMLHIWLGDNKDYISRLPSICKTILDMLPQ